MIESKDFLDEIRAIEQKWQQRWEEEEIFIPKIEKDRPKFFFTVPYPYCNASLHVGHARTYNIGDIISRYKRQRGFNVLWPMAWHITGTPVLSVASRIAQGEEEIIDLYRDYVSIYEEDERKVDEIVRSFSEPSNIAQYFASTISQDFKRMGFGIDFTRQFTTGDIIYNKFVEWQFQKLHNKGYIVKDTYPILYCIRDENAVGEDDIAGGDQEMMTVTEMSLIKFKLNKKFLVAASLRPETVHGVTNIWLDPKTTYMQITIMDEQWIVSPNAVEKLKRQGHQVQIQDTIPATQLLGVEVTAPYTNRLVPILPAEFIDPSYGTGVVYSVPAHAIWDYMGIQALMEEQYVQQFGISRDIASIDPIGIINVKSYSDIPARDLVEQYRITRIVDDATIKIATKKLYQDEFYHGTMKENTGSLAGLSITHAKDKMVKQLDIFYEVSTSAVCRCGGQVIVAVLSDQHFINYGDEEWKKEATRALDQMSIVPSKFRSQFEYTLDWLELRPCVRRRGIGTVFPFTDGDEWIIESLSDSTIYMALYTIIKKIRQIGISPEQLTPAFFDYVLLGEKDPSLPDQTGIDSSIMDEIRMEFTYWYPVDIRHTAIPHLSNHLSFSIFHHVAIFPEEYWPQTFSINELLVKDGEKMSKSRGNVIPIAQIPEKYSVDLIRLYLAAKASPEKVVNFIEEEIMNQKRTLLTFWSICNDIITSSSSYNDDTIMNSTAESFVIQMYQCFRNAVDAIEAFRIREYINHIYFTPLQVITKFKHTSPSKTQYFVAMQTILSIWIKLLAPVIPHLAEELWSRYKQDEFVSLAHIPNRVDLYHHSENYDLDIIARRAYIDKLINDISKIIEIEEITPSKINIFVAPEWKYQIYTLARQYLEDSKVDIAEMMSSIREKEEFREYLSDINTELKLINQQINLLYQDPRSREFEIKALQSHNEELEKAFTANVVLANSISGGSAKKAKIARPMRPGLWIESEN